MTWAGDKKEILSKLVDLYEEINDSPNRYEASRALLREMDFFKVKLISDDPIMDDVINFDREWFDEYLRQMSELMGEEK